MSLEKGDSFDSHDAEMEAKTWWLQERISRTLNVQSVFRTLAIMFEYMRFQFFQKIVLAGDKSCWFHFWFKSLYVV